MQISAFTINAFAKTPEGGNPAGVVFDADELSVVHMKRIAAALKLSETAFVMKSGRPSEIRVSLWVKVDEIQEVRVGGMAMNLQRVEFTI